MGAAIEVISGGATNPSTTFTALTMSPSDSATVRNFPNGAHAVMLEQWAQGATAGDIRTRSPRLHDNVQGIRMQYAASLPVPLWAGYQREELYAQDTLTLEITGGAAELDGFSSLIYYTDLPGTNARLYRWNEVQSRIVHTMCTEVQLTTGGTAFQYGGATAINATFDQFKANTDYAILGYLTNTAIMTVTVKSADFGNLRVGGPGTNNKIETRDWFIRLSDTSGMPCIPVFNSANKANTIVETCCSQTSTAVILGFICAQLTT
jgi:hypothetical protein